VVRWQSLLYSNIILLALDKTIKMEEKKEFKILVVDDSTTNVVLLEAILDEKGYHIETALNAREAYAIIEKETPDLILLDLLMPKISGFDFLEEIRKNKKTIDTPVIVVSALTDEENIDKIMKLGAIDFVKKPIDLQYLVERVESVLQKTYKT
jgi:two-component system, cell cycle response regulator DivK